MKEFFCQSAEKVLEALGSRRTTGLSDAEVQANREKYGKNELTRAEQVGWLQRIWEAFHEPMTLLLVLALVIMVGVNIAHLVTGGETDFIECVGVCVAIVLSVGIAVVMEGRSAKAFEALREMGADVKPRVLRNGQSMHVSQTELVVGDIVFIGTGDKLTADGRLLETSSLIADESALTGESAPVEKDANAEVAPTAPVAERPTMLYAGSFITAGSGLMVVTAVGMGTEFGRIAAALADQTTSKTPLQERLAKLGKLVATAGICAAGLVFLISLGQAWFQDAFTWVKVGESFIAAIVLIVACVPEGLPTIVAMSLAINVMRMAKQNALVKKLVACETIGCVTFICSDKTGTLTENRMAVIALVGADGQPCTTPQETLVKNICINSTADLNPKGTQYIGNPTEGALLLEAAKTGHRPADYRAKAEVEAVEPFSSDTKCMKTQLGKTAPLTLLKGSPEKVLDACGLTAEARKAAEDAMAIWQAKACRVLAFAHRLSPIDAEGAYTYDGFAAIADPVRAEVPEAMEACRTAGIEVMMLTGDNLLTATAIANSLGLLEKGHRAVVAAELEDMNDADFAEAIKTVRVIARSTPSVKLRVVKTLKKQGETVALTGDGINDAPAIKEADVGVAMGITGTEVTKEACDILLLDDAFSTIVRAIRWGRGITDNFKRFILFQLTVNVSAVGVVLLSAIFGFEPPFSALELLWINIIMDGPPALCLGLEKLSDDLLKRAPVRRDEPLVSKGMALRMVVIGLVITALSLAQLKWDYLGAGASSMTALFTLFVMCQLANALSARCPEGGNPFRGLFNNVALLIALVTAGCLQWVIVVYGGAAFNTVALTGTVWAKILLIALCIPVLAAFLPRTAPKTVK